MFKSFAVLAVSSAFCLLQQGVVQAEDLMPTLTERLKQAAGSSSAWPAPGPILKAEEIRNKAAASTAFLSLGPASIMHDAAPTFLGTGWFVAPALLVTNHHMIAGGIDGTVELPSGKACKINRVLADDKEHDLAILEIRYASVSDNPSTGKPQGKVQLATDVSALPLADPYTSIQEGSTVYEFGNPKGYRNTFTQGIVNAYRDGKQVAGKLLKEMIAREAGVEVGPVIDAVKGGDFIQYSTQSDHGSSGSAIINERGGVVGVCAKGDPEGHDVYFAISSKYVKNLLVKAKDPNNPLNRFLK